MTGDVLFPRWGGPAGLDGRGLGGTLAAHSKSDNGTSKVQIELPQGRIWLDGMVVGKVESSSSGETEIRLNIESDRVFEVLNKLAATGAIRPLWK